MKNYKVIVVFFVLVAMLFNGVSAFASDIDQRATEDEATKLHEIIEKRTLSSKVFAMSDGTVRHELYATDIHYKSDSGDLKDIDIKVKDIDSAKNDGYKFKNGENSWDVYFADKGKASDIVQITQDEYTISFSPDSTKSEFSAIKSSQMTKGKSELHDYYMEDPTVVVYSDVMQDVDLAYTIREHCVKEDIILNSVPSSNEFSFTVSTSNLKAVLKDGTVYYNDAKTGETIFFTDGLYMEDSKGKVSTDVSMKLSDLGNGKYKITVIADEKFLKDEGTLYPVVIDPTIQNDSTYDVFVSSAMPDVNMNSGATRMPYLRTGRDTDYGIRRTYIQFRDSDIAGLTPVSGDIVTGAYLDLCEYSSSGSINLRAYAAAGSWSSNELKWINKPGYTGSAVNSFYDGNNWYRMEVTDFIQDWNEGIVTNNGFVVRDANESSTSVWATFRSSDNWSTDRRPKLVVYTSSNWLGTLDIWDDDEEDEIARWNSNVYVYANDQYNLYSGVTTDVNIAVAAWDDAVAVSTTTNTTIADVIYTPAYKATIESFFGQSIPTDVLGVTGTIRNSSNYEGRWFYNGLAKDGYLYSQRIYSFLVYNQCPDTKRKVTCVHEIGHTLGYAGHSDVNDYTQIMNPTPNYNATLSSDNLEHLDQIN